MILSLEPWNVHWRYKSMSRYRLLILGYSLALHAVGCATAHAPHDSMNDPRKTSPVRIDGHLLEIVRVRDPNGPPVSVVLARHEIADALGRNYASVIANGWTGIELDKERLFQVWLPKRFDTAKNRKLAEVSLAGKVVHKPYSLAELGASDPKSLLEKFFEKTASAPRAWWRKNISPEANLLREPDLVATLKSHGFEVSRGDFVPFLLVRPKEGFISDEGCASGCSAVCHKERKEQRRLLKMGTDHGLALSKTGAAVFMAGRCLEHAPETMRGCTMAPQRL